jgi:hypothetical protein
MWDEAAKGKTTPSASAAFEPFGCRCRGFLVLAHACAASSEVWVAASLIEVFDITGKRITAMNPTSSNFTVDMTTMPRGMYTIKIQSANSIQTIRVQRI